MKLKKILALLFCAIIVLAVCGCDNNGKTPDNGNKTPTPEEVSYELFNAALGGQITLSPSEYFKFISMKELEIYAVTGYVADVQDMDNNDSVMRFVYLKESLEDDSMVSFYMMTADDDIKLDEKVTLCGFLSFPVSGEMLVNGSPIQSFSDTNSMIHVTVVELKEIIQKISATEVTMSGMVNSVVLNDNAHGAYYTCKLAGSDGREISLSFVEQGGGIVDGQSITVTGNILSSDILKNCRLINVAE